MIVSGELSRPGNMVGRYLIDPSGETWDVDQLATHQEAGHVPIIASDQRLLDALVIGKGYAGLRITGSACHVFVNPSKIRPATLSALLSAVSNQRSKLIISGSYLEQWRFKIQVSIADGLDHIKTLADLEQRTDCIRSRELSQAALYRSNTPELANAMELIGASGGKLDAEFIEKISRLTNRRFLVCSWQHERHVWRVERSGSGYGKSHLNLSHYQTLGNQPAYQYGCWAHDRYLEVMERATPVVEDVDALLFTPAIGRLRARHRRILAPMTDDNGCAVMLSTSVRDRTIDLGCDDPGAATS